MAKAIRDSTKVDAFSLVCNPNYDDIDKYGKGWNDEDIGYHGLKPGGKKDKERRKINNDKENVSLDENSDVVGIQGAIDGWIIGRHTEKEKDYNLCNMCMSERCTEYGKYAYTDIKLGGVMISCINLCKHHSNIFEKWYNVQPAPYVEGQGGG